MTDRTEIQDVAVIGCGAAGMMAAIAAAETGASSVTVYERNPFAGKKLRITGKGRCNVTNNCTAREVLDAVLSNSKFLYGVINRYTPADTMAFFENAGVPLKTERGRRVFPVSDKAADISDAMIRTMKQYGVKVLYGMRVDALVETDGGVIVKCGNREAAYHSVIVATGGVSYPATGSTGDGHRMLRKMGVNITPLKPSLVPVVTEEDCAPLSGLTLKNVTLTVTHGEDVVYTELGEMLFTHFGVSGPLVLSASSNMQKHPVDSYRMAIDFKPALSAEELDKRILSDFAKYAARDFVNSLSDLLPQKLIPYVIERSGIDPRKKTSAITRAERLKLGEVLKAYELTPTAFRPVDEAIVTSGGVDVKEIHPKTMELKQHPGIFVCGELIDVDAYTGGYNLQLAFSTARAAGAAAAERCWDFE
ncbi:MAG: NAD(P)/FAD-dependent oxidoreductase [Clostridia bacterium]|nr:NAD(P)/FAD-dependent oxidoreductase [Clostridia bacterium]